MLEGVVLAELFFCGDVLLMSHVLFLVVKLPLESLERGVECEGMFG
jgi:hypothetical protein